MIADAVHEAKYYEKLPEASVKCALCPHGCVIADGKCGICGIRENQGGKLITQTYGKVTSVAVDPIEKKPLYHFFPASSILSIGSWGCNFKCSFCQNHSISQQRAETTEFEISKAVQMVREHGSIGIAYTYNEPTINFEFVLDCAKEMHANGLKNVLVTNGYINPEPLAELLPYIDAMNIDIKAFHEGFYSDLCKAKLEPVLETAKLAKKSTHVEITTLLIPEQNDAPKELAEEAKWIKENLGQNTPVHLSAYFPRYKLNAETTSLKLLENARDIFMKELDYVYLGNVPSTNGGDTACSGCGKTIITRSGYAVDVSGLNPEGTCRECGAQNNFINEDS